jgi:hypothetical protein
MGTSQPWELLAALPAWQVTEIPRPDGDPGRDSTAGQRLAALTSAYGSDEPLAVAWLRDRPGGPVRVLTAGPALASGRDGGQTLLTLPPGARSVSLPGGDAARMLAGLPYWTRISGISDVLLADEDGQLDGQVPPSLEDGLLSAWLDAFGWLLLAEPVAERTVAEMAVEAARAQMHAENDSSPRAKLAARRTAARHAELRQATTAGLWRIHLLAGAATADGAARVARLVCASADLRRLPYALSARRTAAPLPDTVALTQHLTTVPAPPVTPPPPGPDGRSWWDTPIGEQDHPGPAQQWPDPRQPVSIAEAAARAADERDTMVPESPFHGSTRLLAALARPPASEVPGVLFTLRPSFDVTPEPAVMAGPAISAGTVLDRNRVPAGTLTVPLTSLNRHVLVCGATGSGKSQTVRHLLEQATATGIPWLVIEPAKAEYRLMASRLPDTEVIRIRPGALDQAAAGINPLEPAPGPGGSRFPLQVHADLLRSLFLAAFQADEPFPQILAAALTRCYEQAGWDLVTGQSATPGIQPAYPSLEDLQTAALTVVNEAGYGREVRDNVKGFVTVRIGSLRQGTTGRFLDGGHPINFATLVNTNVVLEIEDAGDDHDKAFLIGAVLVRLTEYLRLRARSEPPGPVRLRHLTVVEEAHRLLRQPPPGAPAGPAAHAVEMFADLLAEVRAYGEGLIIAEQIPVKLIPDAIKNTALKIAHRLPAADDRAVVGATINLHEAQSEYLVTLRPGEAAVHADGMDYPLLARMPDGTERETTTLASTAPPDTVISSRSVTCGPDCTARPCTLGQMRAAQRATITDRRLTLWTELTVVAHLTGWEMPRPALAFTEALRATGTRLRDCALAHATDAAVTARIPAISTRISPDDLATHAVTAMRQVITSGTPGCADEESDYLAPPYRWMLVRGALRAADPGDGRHPRSDEWEQLYSEPIPGATIAQQLRVINRRYAEDQRGTAAVTAVVWGTRPSSAIEQAVGVRPDSDDWAARLNTALTAFARLPWPRKLLVRPTAKQAASE